MDNIEFWNSINKYNEHCNPNGGELVCDQMVKEGLGQTVGGYFEVANYPKYKRSIDKEIAEPSQAFHFFEYYIDENNCSNNKPSYARLKCPQLIMYIAEMAGLKREILLECLDFIRKIEEDANLVGTEKGGAYLEKMKSNNNGNRLSELKEKIHISDIQNIISDEKDYKEIVRKVSLIV